MQEWRENSQEGHLVMDSVKGNVGKMSRGLGMSSMGKGEERQGTGWIEKVQGGAERDKN